jgi:T4 RnlA family RNA ligase
MYLPSYEDCVKICEKFDNFNFYETILYIDGYKISLFNYRLAHYNYFIDPMGDNSIDAKELRGLAFVFNEDGSLFKRYLCLNKFFNLNQVEETQYSLIKNIPIKSLYDKCDGSVINFIKLPNGRILAKSKMCFDNNQALNSMKFYEDNIDIKNMVNWCLFNDIMPIMEYVSPQNRVVLKYHTSKLILLRFRCLKTGKYIDLDYYPLIDNIETSQKEELLTWDELLELSKTIENKEGWVAMLDDENNSLVKLKTKWYCDLHHMFDDIVGREDYMIKKIVDEEIDDVIAQLEIQDTEILSVLNNVTDVVNDYIKNTVNHVENLLEKYKNFSKKEIIIDYGKNDKYRGYLLSVIDGKNTVLEAVCEDLKKNTFKLESARSFIKNKNF